MGVVMLGSCVAGPLLHTPEIDTSIEAFRTRGTTIAKTENTRYLFHDQWADGRLVRNPSFAAASGSGSDSTGRRLASPLIATTRIATTDGADHRRTQSTEFSMCDNCWHNMDSIYSAGTDPAGGGNVLTAATFRSICEWEDRLADEIDYHTHCAKSAGECCLPLSLPRLLSTTSGVPCESLTDAFLRDAFSLIAQESDVNGINPKNLQEQFLDDTFSVGTAGSRPSAWLTRSLLCLDRNTYGETDNYRKQRKAMGKQLASLWQQEDGLAEQVGNELPGADGISLYSFNRYMFEQLFEDQLLTDLNLAGVAMIVLLFAMVLHTGSFCLAVCGMVHILLSVPAAYSLYTAIGFTYFPYINLIGIFVVAGVGVDDVYVFYDAFSQSLVLLPPGTSLEIRLSWAFRRAATAMLITSATTSASFLANLVSPIPPIRVFGIFNGILIFANYAFVITWFPTVIVLHHRYAMDKRCCCCCRERKPTRVTVRDTQAHNTRQADLARVTNVPPAAIVQPHTADWRRVESFCRTRYTAALHRFRWAVLALLIASVVMAAVFVARRLTLATKIIQMMRSSHPMTVYADLLGRFPSSPHVPEDGMEVWRRQITVMLTMLLIVES